MKMFKKLFPLIILITSPFMLFMIPCDAHAVPIYEWQTFLWGPTSEDMIYGPNHGQTWQGEWSGYIGEFQYGDQTLTYGNFMWISLGIYESSQPPGPWRTGGEVQYPTAIHITSTYFSWYDQGFEGDIDHHHTVTVSESGEITQTPIHAKYLTNIPVPEPSTLLLLGSGLAAAIAFGRKRLFKGKQG